jgi:hypothetical protein
MNKIKEIFKAWNISFNPNDEQAELASKRIEICNSCEFKKKNVGINTCSVCGCALKKKVFSPVKGACPKGKWDDVDEVFNINVENTNKERNTKYDENTAVTVSGNLLSDVEYQKYLNFIYDENTNWGERSDDNYWAGRIIPYQNFNHLKSNNMFGHLEILNAFLLEKFRNKLKANFKIKEEIHPEYLSLIKWEVNDFQIPRSEATEDLYPWRDFSCIYHLNDDYEGGEMYFPKQDIVFKPAANTLIFFPGHSEYEYGIMPIRKGVRHTITSFWTFDNEHSIKFYM